MSWIDELLDATKETEVPPVFFKWAGYAVISAVLRRSVWVDRGGFYHLYPNFFCLIVAESGLIKSFPVNVAAKIVKKCKITRVLAHMNSIQGVVSRLKNAYTIEGITEPITDARGAVFSEEFSNFVIDDPQAFTILTQLYDAHYNEEFIKSLKHEEDEILKEPCLTLIGATNPTHFRDKIKDKDISGGFIARTFIVYEDQPGPKNPLLEIPEVPFSIDKLVEYPRALSKVSGPMEVTKDAKEAFRSWYMDNFDPKVYEDRTGMINRIKDHVFKMAMIIAMARSLERKILGPDIEDAIDLVFACYANTRRVLAGAGRSLDSPATATILSDLLQHPEGCTRIWLLNKHQGDITVFDLDRVLETMTQAEAITTERTGVWGGKRDVLYKLKPKMREYFIKKAAFQQKKKA